jgi:hypothetical protein
LQADCGSDTRLPVALPFANEQLDMAASQQANRMIPLPESQRASSSQLSDIEAADEPDRVRANSTLNINDATFCSGEDHDLEYLHALLRSLFHKHLCLQTQSCFAPALHASSSPVQGS